MTRGTMKLNIDNHHGSHKLTICILEIHEGNANESSLVNAKLQDLMETFLNHLRRDDLKNWGLSPLIPCPNDASTQATQILNNLKISYDTIELSNKHNHSDHNHAAKRIIFPSGNGADKQLEEKSEQSAYDYAISYSDVVLILDASEDKSNAENKIKALIRNSLCLGKPILEINSKGSITLLTAQMVPNLELALIKHGLIHKELIAQYGREFSAENITTDIFNGIKNSLENYSDIDRTLKGGRFVKLSGRIDAAISTLFSGFKWAELVKALKKNPLNIYYGVGITDLPEEQRGNHPIREMDHLKTAFSKYDIAANYFSGIYRDGNWILYFLSAFAVFSAVSGAISLGGSINIWLWALAECLCIAGIIFLVLASKKHKYHRRWLFNRFYAETIRYARVGLPFLVVPYCLKNFHYGLDNFLSHGKDSLSEDDLTSVHGHLKLNQVARLIMDAGLPEALARKPYNPAAHFDDLVNYSRLILSDQIQFHKKTFHRNEKIAHSLHKISFYCFALTVIGIAGHFIIHSDIWLIFTAALPALAGAIHGLVTQNEYERVSQISSVAFSRLNAMLETIQNTVSWKNLDETERFLKLQLLMEDAIEVMSGSAQSWQEIIQGRETTLPA
jgi:hypothetical protein